MTTDQRTQSRHTVQAASTEEPTASSSTAAPPQAARSARPKRRRTGRLRRWAIRSVAGLVGLLALAATVTALLDARDARRHPPPGDLVQLSDGRVLHLQVAGEQHGGPTVVLDAGFGAFSPAFARLQEELAHVATVVAYDRPGYGWSDPADGPVDAQATAADLHEALATRGLRAPYILVGHSLGAHYARVFAERFADDVAGLVLLGPAHEAQFDRVPGAAAQIEQMNRMLQWAPRLARLGVFRVYNPQAAALEGLPDPAAGQLAAISVTARHLRASAREGVALRDIAASVTADFGRLPVRVVSASVPEPGFEQARAVQDELHREFVARSPSATHQVVAGADHVTLITHARHARTVAGIVADLVVEVR